MEAPRVVYEAPKVVYETPAPMNMGGNTDLLGKLKLHLKEANL
jgi:hypothetical protein